MRRNNNNNHCNSNWHKEALNGATHRWIQRHVRKQPRKKGAGSPGGRPRSTGPGQVCAHRRAALLANETHVDRRERKPGVVVPGGRQTGVPRRCPRGVGRLQGQRQEVAVGREKIHQTGKKPAKVVAKAAPYSKFKFGRNKKKNMIMVNMRRTLTSTWTQ